MTSAIARSLAVAGLCALLLAATWLSTRDRIAANRSAAERAQLSALIGRNVQTSPQWRNGIFSAGDGRRVVRVQVQGYGGPMTLLVGLAESAADGAPVLLGVRVARHQETPGIADFLNRPDSGWLADLAGRSAAQLQRVDGVSGATITSRALLRGVRQAAERMGAGAAGNG